MSKLISAMAIGSVIIGLLAGSVAHATPVTPGEQFTINFTETSGQQIGLTATATITLGPVIQVGPPELFSISNFSAINNSDGTCLTCGIFNVNLSGASFDASDLDLAGLITGSFFGQGGGTHNFTLSFTDPGTPGGTWIFDDLKLADGSHTVSSGTYTTVVAQVPEPASIAIFLAALLGLGFISRSKNLI